MFAFIISDLANLESFLRQPWFWLITAFQIWMLVDAIRREEWVWALLIFLFSGLTAFFYYLMVYRGSPSTTQGFEFIIWTRRIITRNSGTFISNKASWKKPRPTTALRWSGTQTTSTQGHTWVNACSG
jgi:hypothetical protein